MLVIKSSESNQMQRESDGRVPVTEWQSILRTPIASILLPVVDSAERIATDAGRAGIDYALQPFTSISRSDASQVFFTTNRSTLLNDMSIPIPCKHGLQHSFRVTSTLLSVLLCVSLRQPL